MAIKYELKQYEINVLQFKKFQVVPGSNKLGFKKDIQLPAHIRTRVLESEIKKLKNELEEIATINNGLVELVNKNFAEAIEK